MFHALLKSLQVDIHDSHDHKLNLLHPLKFPRERTLKNDLVTDAGGLYMGDERNNMTQRGPDVNAVQYYTDKNMATVKRHTVPR